MATVGFNFTKINAERKNASEKNIKINNNVTIISVKEQTMSDPKKSLLKFEFNFVCLYEPEVGKIELEGELVELLDKEVSTKIAADWEKEKKLPKEVFGKVLNAALTKSNIEALIISRELNLPSPIMLPKLQMVDPAQAAAMQKEEKAAKPETKLKDEKKKK